MSSSFLDEMGNVVLNATCSILAADIRAQRLLRRRGFPNGATLQIAEQIRRALCSNNTPPGFEPETEAGQCPTAYQVDFDCGNVVYGAFGGADIFVNAHYQNQIQGPLTGFEIEIPGMRVGGISRFEGAPLNYSLAGTTNAGSFFSTADGSVTKNNRDNQAIGPVTNLTIVRVDGLPDMWPSCRRFRKANQETLPT